MVATLRKSVDLTDVVEPSQHHTFALDSADPIAAIRRLAPNGIDRVVDVAFSDNIDLDAQVTHNGYIIAVHGSRQDQPAIPSWPLLFNIVTVRLLGSDDSPVVAK